MRAVYALALLTGLVWGLACTPAEIPGPCDPGLFAARMQAVAIECRTVRMRECPGVSQDAFERSAELCHVAQQCYAQMDREAVACVGQ